MTTLTKVYLDGPLGKAFGREWEFEVSSPNEALRMVDANKPGVFAWLKSQLRKFNRYRVMCEYEDGRKEDLDNDSYMLERKLKSVRFVPILEGASAVFRVVVGIVLVVAGVVFQQPWMIKAGIAVGLGGIIEMLSPRPKQQSQEDQSNNASYLFDGPVNTVNQGVPVQLIYGRLKVGSHPVSASVTIDQLK